MSKVYIKVEKCDTWKTFYWTSWNYPDHKHFGMWLVKDIVMASYFDNEADAIALFNNRLSQWKQQANDINYNVYTLDKDPPSSVPPTSGYHLKEVQQLIFGGGQRVNINVKISAKSTGKTVDVKKRWKDIMG